MDPRRLLALGAIALALAACSHLPRPGLSKPRGAPALATPALAASRLAVTPAMDTASPAPSPDPPRVAGAPGGGPPAPSKRAFAIMAPIPDPDRRPGPKTPHGIPPSGPDAARAPAPSGRMAIAAANAAARQTSGARAFVGGVQVFAYDPGRVYEVWTAPLRVTTLTLSPGEAVISKAAGDTVRWQIGETRSGEGADQRAHVMIKPLVRGLETNLVIATSRRIYLMQLRSGGPDAFNAAVTWDLGSVLDAPPAGRAPAAAPEMVTPQGLLDAGFRIRPRGRRPAWTPSAVATDGVRTFLHFPPAVTAGEAPALFALGEAGEAQLVNYRQQGGLWVVDRVLGAAELRMGGRRAQVVRIERIGAPS